MKILYKPFAIISSVVASRIGKTLFKNTWSQIDDHEPPEPTIKETTMAKVVGAAVLEAAIMAGVAAVISRSTARAFHHLTGSWPGDKEAEELDKEEEESD